ncbi:MAG: hypothetical protein ING19_20845 [Azospirillum sp.]|nr:hypothetical protein [Azospirillum sp.]MCA3268500.1 hypothetical protein [Azospirillum sp.]
MFDLDALVYADTREIAIKDPAGKPTTWRVSVAGPGHPASAAARAKADQRQQALEAKRAAAIHRNEAPPAADFAEAREFYADQLAMRIVGWSPVRFSGEDFAYTAENARRLLTEPRFGFVANQIAEAVQDLSGFMTGAAPS